jgi:hypothetical protein
MAIIGNSFSTDEYIITLATYFVQKNTLATYGFKAKSYSI